MRAGMPPHPTFSRFIRKRLGAAASSPKRLLRERLAVRIEKGLLRLVALGNRAADTKKFGRITQCAPCV